MREVKEALNRFWGWFFDFQLSKDINHLYMQGRMLLTMDAIRAFVGLAWSILESLDNDEIYLQLLMSSKDSEITLSGYRGTRLSIVASNNEIAQSISDRFYINDEFLKNVSNPRQYIANNFLNLLSLYGEFYIDFPITSEKDPIGKVGDWFSKAHLYQRYISQISEIPIVVDPNLKNIDAIKLSKSSVLIPVKMLPVYTWFNMVKLAHVKPKMNMSEHDIWLLRPQNLQPFEGNLKLLILTVVEWALWELAWQKDLYLAYKNNINNSGLYLIVKTSPPNLFVDKKWRIMREIYSKLAS